MATLLLGVFLLFALINLGYYLAFFSFAGARDKENAAPAFPVSVIVCAKNEAENLNNFLPSILEQDYPDYEIILINDASVDNSLEVMEKYQALDGRIKIVDVENNEAFWANKKYALTLGIKKAKHDHLIFTDADCSPQSKNWLRRMAEKFSAENSIILGYGGYFRNKGSLLNKLIRFETLLTAIQYFAYARLGRPYMGVGRNLAYTSTQFYQQKGFANHLHLRSGDDDLFVNEAATANNTAICFHRESFTRSVPKQSFKKWFEQKRRHASIAKHYKSSDKLLLGLFYSSRLLFWLLFIILMAFQIYPQITLGAIGVLLVTESIVYFKAARKLEELDVVWLFPFLEVFLIFSQLAIFIANIFSKPTHWK
ncbi:glycosyltransferase [Salegentibacter chungangensis]|uniref:Glycosyltransferase n=1 Tax=Salegentibacter chungangensis TaxID=1335724 RepID=A0ABW3NVY1_9FLAO